MELYYLSQYYLSEIFLYADFLASFQYSVLNFHLLDWIVLKLDYFNDCYIGINSLLNK